MRRYRSIRRGLAQRRIAVRRSFADSALGEGDEPPFEERDLDIAAGADEKHRAASEAAA